MDFELNYWLKKYETDYPSDTGGVYPTYLDKNGILREEKSPYFETMSNLLATRGFLFKTEFVSIGRWKAHRQINNYQANSEEQVKKITHQVLAEKDEGKQVKLLICGELKGVKIPVASAILTIIYPEKYCITDYRAWRALKWWQNVSNDGHLVLSGYEKYCDYVDSLNVYDTLQSYMWYLKSLRSLSAGQKKTPRQFEMALWKFDEMKGVKT